MQTIVNINPVIFSYGRVSYRLLSISLLWWTFFLVNSLKFGSLESEVSSEELSEFPSLMWEDPAQIWVTSSSSSAEGAWLLSGTLGLYSCFQTNFPCISWWWLVYLHQNQYFKFHSMQKKPKGVSWFWNTTKKTFTPWLKGSFPKSWDPNACHQTRISDVIGSFELLE